jgi:hypothetical protein
MEEAAGRADIMRYTAVGVDGDGGRGYQRRSSAMLVRARKAG